MRVERKLSKGVFVEIRQFEGDSSQVSWPEDLVAELESLTPAEQLRYFYKDADYQQRNDRMREKGEYGWKNHSCYYNLPVAAVEMLDGKIAALHYDGHRIALGDCVCTYHASDNNGAGYKERTDYASLHCGEPIDFPRDFYRIDGDTVFFNASMPTDPYAFMYVLVTPWEREAQQPIRHVVIEDGVESVPGDLLTFMRGLETVRQPAAINRVLVREEVCQTYIGGIRVPKAFVSWDGKLVRVQEDVEEIRILDSITCLSPWAFADCPSLKRVIIHAGVAEVEEGVFAAFGEDLTLCCEVEEKPEGWVDEIERAGGPKVIWGYKG